MNPEVELIKTYLDSAIVIAQTRRDLHKITVFTHPFLTLRWTEQDRLRAVIETHSDIQKKTILELVRIRKQNS